MQRKLLWILLFLVSLSSSARAQFENGAVLGTIRDASQAVVPGAGVTLTSINTGVERNAQSDAAGNYQFLNVAPGQYQVQASSEGFKTAVSDIFTVVVGARQRADIALEVGSTTETIEGTGAAPIIETDSSDRATVIGSKQAVDLPLNGRSYADLTLLAPGTSQSLRGSLSGRDASYHVNGQRSSFNNFSLDGVDNNSYGTSNQGFSSQVVQLSPDAVGEFKVVTDSFSAEYGRAGGAVINAAYRSGTNQYHVTLWEFLRNTDLNATGFFKPANGKPNLVQNQFGAAGGGPIVKNRAFFFADFEALRRRQSQLRFATLPTHGATSRHRQRSHRRPLHRQLLRRRRHVVPLSSADRLSRRSAGRSAHPNRGPAIGAYASATTSSRCPAKARTTTRATSRATSTSTTSSPSSAATAIVNWTWFDLRRFPVLPAATPTATFSPATSAWSAARLGPCRRPLCSRCASASRTRAAASSR